MKKLAILAVVLLTTSCAVSEDPVSAPVETESQSSDSGVTLDAPEVEPQSAEEGSETPQIKIDSPEVDAGELPETQNDSTQQQPESEFNSGSVPDTDSQDSQQQAQPEAESESDSGDSETVDTAPPGRETVNSYIDLLQVSPEVTSGYDRDLFRHWVDADRDGCHAREETLIAESVGSVNVTGDCDISGSWFSAFDGETTTNPSNFDVDHLVPLKEAWDSGANRWDSGTRERFANDLGSPHSLIAVSRGSNRSKGAKDPAEWLPPRQSYHCEYVFTWTLVKIRWSLSADQAEINALRDVGGDCFVDEMNFSPAVTEAEIIAGNPPEPAPEPEPTPEADGELDPRFSSCEAAKAEGYGPYVDGVDPEYDWYRDGDSDGTVCE